MKQASSYQRLWLLTHQSHSSRPVMSFKARFTTTRLQHLTFSVKELHHLFLQFLLLPYLLLLTILRWFLQTKLKLQLLGQRHLMEAAKFCTGMFTATTELVSLLTQHLLLFLTLVPVTLRLAKLVFTTHLWYLLSMQSVLVNYQSNQANLLQHKFQLNLHSSK